MSESEIIQMVWKLCNEFLGPKYKLFLFGSRASKTNNKYSDFDFYIKGNTPIPDQAWQKFTDSVQKIQTLHKIDLVDYNKAGADFQMVATKSAQEIVNGQIRSQD